MWYIHTIEYHCIKKEGNSDACCNMDESWRHAKWKKERHAKWKDKYCMIPLLWGN